MKFTKLRWPAFFSMAALALSGYWLIQFWLGPQVVGFTVVKETLVRTVFASGKVALPASIEISSRVGGQVAAVNVAEGQSVRAGEILFTLENKDVRGTIEKARAATALAEARFRKISEQTQAGSAQSLRCAQATLDKTKKQYARIRELAAKGFVSQDQSSDALRNLTIAQSQLATTQFQAKANRAKGSDFALAELALRQARANERSVREKSGGRVIKAESDGVLIACKVARGERVLPGKTLMVISSLGKKQVIMQVNEKDMRDLKLGQQAFVAAEGYSDQRFKAEISYISPTPGAMRDVFDVKLDAGNAPAYLRQDMLVSVEFEVSRRADALTLTSAAVRDADSAEPWVMVVENGLTHRRMVKLGGRANAKIEILDGLHEGDHVLPATGFEVEEGKRVRLARAG